MARLDTLLSGSLAFRDNGVELVNLTPHNSELQISGSVAIKGPTLKLGSGGDIGARITTLESATSDTPLLLGGLLLWSSSINVWTESFDAYTGSFAYTSSNYFTGSQFFTGSLIPQADISGSGLFDLGSASKPWRDLYLTSCSLKFVRNGEVISSVTGETEGIRVGNILITTSSLSLVNDAGVVIDTIYKAVVSGSGELQQVTQQSLPSGIVSSSAQINSLNFLSASIQGIVSRSAQITELGFITASRYSEILEVPTGIVSSSTQLASAISGAGAVTYVTSSNYSLKELQVNDYDADVAAVFDDSAGKLTLTFGTPATPSSVTLSTSGFDTDRFNQTVDSYNITATWNNGGYTFLTASIFEGSTFLTESHAGTSITFATSSIGSHSYKLAYTASSPLDNSLYKETENLTVSLSKSNPNQPSLTTTADVQLGASSNQIEQGATGSITITSSSSATSNQWELDRTETNFKTPYAVTGSATGSTSISITATAYYDSPSGENSPNTNTTRGRTNTFTKIRSVRYGASTLTAFTAEQLADLSLWDSTIGGSVGTIDKGNTNPSGDSITITFSGDKYHYIVYDSSRSDLSNITTSGFGVLGQFTKSTVGSYTVYRSTTLQAGGGGSSITYDLT